MKHMAMTLRRWALGTKATVGRSSHCPKKRPTLKRLMPKTHDLTRFKFLMVHEADYDFLWELGDCAV